MKIKKIKLNKVTVASLTDTDMSFIRGATLAWPSCECSETKSCSVYIDCCPPKEKFIVNTEDY